jgi:hypothetical protein
MGKKIILFKKKDSVSGVDSKTLIEYTFAEHIMNINSKLDESQSLSLINQISPLLAQSFITKNSLEVQSLIEAFMHSLDNDDMKKELSQEQNNESKLILFFKHSIKVFQKCTEDESFAEAIEKHQDFYLLALSCFESVPLNLIVDINERHEGFL